jgi:pyridoxine 5-phosphate synthase
MNVRLHVNVDHVATLRQARGTQYPDPVEAAIACERAGAHGITVHLREDRRHIQDHDVERLRPLVKTVLNLEMAATDAMVDIALAVRPDVVTLVPERREERTTEGGLDVASQLLRLRALGERLAAQKIRTSLFIDPEETQVRASMDAGADTIELHTGDYCAAEGEARARELERLATAAALGSGRMSIAAGHGLTAQNLVALVARVPSIVELNIGHALVSDAVFVGLPAAVGAYLAAIAEGERQR